MKNQSSRKLVSFELEALLILLAFAMLWVPATAQQDNRQLNRDNAQQANRASGRRIALVIGNGAYTNAPPLKNPPNDARDMAATLKELGFDVTSGINVNQRDMKRLIREFGQALKAGGSGLFYYAGHGVQSKGKNYLIPIEADIESEVEVEDAGVDVNLVLGYMDDAQNGLNIVILDACRDNPFARSFRSAGKGLAQVDAPTGTLIAYATAPGRVASDGTGQNGLYTAELLKQMRVPGLSTTDMFMHVRAEVMKQTANKQVPWEASSLVGAFYFTAPVKSATDSTLSDNKIDPKAVEREYWETIRSSTDAQDYKDYLQTYPNGAYAVIARAKIRQLDTPKTASPTSSPAGKGDQISTSSARLGGDANTAADRPTRYGGPKSYPARQLAVSEDPRMIGRRKLVDMPAISLTDETTLGRSLAAQVNGQSVLVGDAAVKEYINRVGQNVVLHSDAKVPFTIQIIDSTELSAFALPGGYMYLTSGLILSVDSESELAALIAHHVGHTVRRHGFINSQQTRSKSLAAFTTFDHNAEIEADLLAVQYLYATGYEPNALASGSATIVRNQRNILPIFVFHLITTDELEKVDELISQFPVRSQYVTTTDEFGAAKERLAKVTHAGSGDAQPNVASKPSNAPPDLKGLDILIYYRNMEGVNRMTDANKMADRLKARGANVYLTLMDAKELKGIFRYRQQDADIARRIMEFVADIESLKLEAALPSPEFHIFLQ